MKYSKAQLQRIAHRWRYWPNNSRSNKI